MAPSVGFSVSIGCQDHCLNHAIPLSDTAFPPGRILLENKIIGEKGKNVISNGKLLF
jgi:hypothetical protein